VTVLTLHDKGGSSPWQLYPSFSNTPTTSTHPLYLPTFTILSVTTANMSDDDDFMQDSGDEEYPPLLRFT
jgi:hypothetical protein